jgi:hypothetical protein
VLTRSQNVNTVDVIFPAWPAFLYLNPAMCKALLLPLFQYQGLLSFLPHSPEIQLMVTQRLDCTPTFVSGYPKVCADSIHNFRQPWSVHDMGAHYPVADGM